LPRAQPCGPRWLVARDIQTKDGYALDNATWVSILHIRALMCKGSKQRAEGERLANDEGSSFRKYPPFDKMSLSNHKALGCSSLIAGIKLQSIRSQRSFVVNRYLVSLLGLALTFYSIGDSRNLALHKEICTKDQSLDSSREEECAACIRGV
jgi:hypothetical protein